MMNENDTTTTGGVPAVQAAPNTQLAKAMETSVIMAAVAREVALTPADQAFRFRLPRLGKIHLGVRVQSAGGVEHPKATDHFVLPESLLSDPEFQGKLAEIGEDQQKPRILPIRLPCNALPGNLQSSCDLYGSSRGLICRTYDARTARKVDPETGEIQEIVCAQATGGDCCKGCEWIHRLKVLLFDAVGLGYWQIDFKSPNSKANLLVGMTQTKRALGGRLGGVDLFLTLSNDMEFSVPMKGRDGTMKVQKTRPWILYLRLPVSMRRLEETAVDATAFDDAEFEVLSEADDMPVVENGGAEESQAAEEPESVQEAEVLPEAEPDDEATGEPPAPAKAASLMDAVREEYKAACKAVFGAGGVGARAAKDWQDRQGVQDIKALPIQALRDLTAKVRAEATEVEAG